MVDRRTDGAANAAFVSPNSIIAHEPDVREERALKGRNWANEDPREVGRHLANRHRLEGTPRITDISDRGYLFEDRSFFPTGPQRPIGRMGGPRRRAS